MAGTVGKSGRRPGPNRKKNTVAARLDDADYECFRRMMEKEASALRPKGIDLTESDFLRALIYEAAEKRGEHPATPAAPAAEPSKAKPRAGKR